MKTFLLVTALFLAVGLVGACVNSALYTARTQKSFPPEGVFAEVNGARVHVIEAGKTGPAVLMIHGASANANEFDWSLAPRLAADHRVFMADRPGHGYSGRPANAEELGVQAAQMAGALDRLAPGERAVVVGHSFGGAVALRLALDHPDKVKALVLLAPVSHDWGVAGTAWYNEWAAPPLLGHAFAQLLPIVGPARARDGVAGTFHPKPAPEHYYEKSAVPLLFRPGTFRANARDVKALRLELAAQSARYDDLEIPVVLYSGLKDTVLRPELHAGKLKHQVANFDLIELPETGHMPHHAHGAAIAETIRGLADSIHLADMPTENPLASSGGAQ